jgi:mono/diheme cytochrome c family protein
MSRDKIISVVCLVLLAGIAAFIYWFLTQHSFSARAKPMMMETFLAKHVRKLALPPGIQAMKNPLEVSPLLIAQARDHFAVHCATCHGNLGDGKTMIGEGLYPPPPNMRTEETQTLSDGEIFYIIKNGIRFTGMPGFGGSDEDNWKLVAFIRHIPNLSEDEIKLMKEANNLEVSYGK